MRPQVGRRFFVGIVAVIIILITAYFLLASSDEGQRYVCADGVVVASPSLCPEQEKDYKYQKTFQMVLGYDDVGLNDYKQCEQRFAEDYGNSDVKCEVAGQTAYRDDSGTTKIVYDCKCKY